MLNLLKKVNKKIDSLIWTFVSTGIILVLLAILVVWTDFMLKLTVGMIILVIAYSFVYTGFRLWSFKKDLTEYFKIK